MKKKKKSRRSDPDCLLSARGPRDKIKSRRLKKNKLCQVGNDNWPYGDTVCGLCKIPNIQTTDISETKVESFGRHPVTPQPPRAHRTPYPEPPTFPLQANLTARRLRIARRAACSVPSSAPTRRETPTA
jgi:hypothetical protein